MAPLKDLDFKLGNIEKDVPFPRFIDTLSIQILKTVDVGYSFTAETDLVGDDLRKFQQRIQKRFQTAAKKLGYQLRTRTEAAGLRIWRVK